MAASIWTTLGAAKDVPNPSLATDCPPCKVDRTSYGARFGRQTKLGGSPLSKAQSPPNSTTSGFITFQIPGPVREHDEVTHCLEKELHKPVSSSSAMEPTVTAWTLKEEGFSVACVCEEGHREPIPRECAETALRSAWTNSFRVEPGQPSNPAMPADSQPHLPEE